MIPSRRLENPSWFMTVAVFECLVCRPPEFVGAFGFDEAGKSEFQAGMIVIGSMHCRGETRGHESRVVSWGRLNFL
jgi:hypothetical protein